MIGQKGIPARSGGVERHVEEIATRLAKSGHEVFVYCRKHYASENLKEYKGVHLIHLPTLQTKHLDAIIHTFLATCHVLTQKADVVHYHAIGPSSLLWIVKIFKRNSKVVATFHCQDYFHEKWGVLARAYLRFGELIACTVPDVTITVSKTLQDYVQKKYRRETLYIPNGTNLPEKESVSELDRFGLTPGRYVLYVGRLVRHKGLHDLIRAFQGLPKTVSLVIAGKNAYTSEYEWELLRLAKDDPRIVFVGEQVGRPLKALFSHAALYVCPSFSEGLSIALLEAMSYGLPVLTSDIKENLEVVGDDGFSFKTRDVADLQDKISYILKHAKEAAKKGIGARERIARTYLWEHIVPQLEGIYEERATPLPGLEIRYVRE